MNIGKRMKELRDEKHISQEELSLLTGISQETISAIETGQADSVSAGKIARIATALCVSVTDLFLLL